MALNKKRAPKSAKPSRLQLLQRTKGKGQQRIPVNEEMLLALAKIQCTQAEIASVLKIDENCIERHHRDILQQGYDEGKKTLRRMQWDAAQKGSVPMLIWLGKQYLGQKDRTAEEAQAITFNVLVKESP